MVLFDTNTVIRYILQDDHDMADLVERQIAKDLCFIPTEVVAELIYVLNKVYNVDR
jgi:predicted nucleic-acid-binding protein